MVEHDLAKVGVASSSLVSRSKFLHGGLAEWPCSGLQIRPPRFDSGTRLHLFALRRHLASPRPGGEIGKHSGFKIRRRMACRFESGSGHHFWIQCYALIYQGFLRCCKRRWRAYPPFLWITRWVVFALERQAAVHPRVLLASVAIGGKGGVAGGSRRRRVGLSTTSVDNPVGGAGISAARCSTPVQAGDKAAKAALDLTQKRPAMLSL